MKQRGNIRTNLPDATRAEVVEGLVEMGGGEVRVERIVSGGQASPAGFWYDQVGDEWVVVLEGGAELEFAEPAGEERLGVGDWLFIPAHRRHRVRMTEPGTVWLAVHAEGVEASHQR